MTDKKELDAGSNAPDEVNVIVEISRGDHNKYEMDKETGYIVLDRVNATSMGYPADYGYIPKTLCEDGDPLDALIVIDESLFHGAVLKVRPIGVLYMVDDSEKDEKIVCVPVNDVSKSHINSIDDLGPNFKPVIEHFYSHYKDWKNNWQGSSVSFDGWGDAAAAKKVISESIERYKG